MISRGIFMYTIAQNKPDMRELVLSKGISYPDNQSLIALLLGSGTRGCPVQKLAKKVLDVLEGVRREHWLQALCQIQGMGKSRAIAILAAIELGRRMNSHFGKRINQPADFIPLVQGYAMQSREHFLCATLTGAHEIISIRVVSIGTVNRTLIHPREVFADAVQDRAAAVILCHNHPSGSLRPSSEDIAATQKLVAASDCLGIRVLDHLIITMDGYYSFKEEGLLLGDLAELVELTTSAESGI